MQNGEFPAGAAIAGAAFIAANTPIAIRADKDHRIVFSLLKKVRPMPQVASRAFCLACVNSCSCAGGAVAKLSAASSPFSDCFKRQPRLHRHIPAHAQA
jgi:hypothetical protein